MGYSDQPSTRLHETATTYDDRLLLGSSAFLSTVGGV